MGIKIVFAAIAFFNAVLALAAHFITLSFRQVFVELLADEPLPVFSSLMLGFTPVWPVLFTLVSIVFFLLADKLQPKQVVVIILSMFLIEGVLLIMSIAGLMQPLIQIVDKLS